MFINKKLLLITLFSLSFAFNGLAITSVKTNICDFNPERDTQPIINIFNDNRDFLVEEEDASQYECFLKKCHEHPFCTIKILRENEELAGYIFYHKHEHQGLILGLAVAHEFRRKGYGKLLTSTALEELYNKDIDHIALICHSDSTPALNLYEKMGFKQIDEDVFGNITLKHKKPKIKNHLTKEK